MISTAPKTSTLDITCTTLPVTRDINSTVDVMCTTLPVTRDINRTLDMHHPMCHWEVVHMVSMVLVLGAMDIMCHWEGCACDIHGKIGFKRGLFLPPAWWPATRRRRRQLFSPVS